MAMMIENKIATTEHSNQLDRYYRSMLEAGSGWDTGWNVACVYLTPWRYPFARSVHSLQLWSSVRDIGWNPR